LKLREEGVRTMIAAALLSFMIVVGADLWFIDLLSRQREFTIFLGAELVAFSMMLYVTTRTSFGEVKKEWFLTGCLCLAFFLALTLTTGW
jgi:hypothetical protein